MYGLDGKVEYDDEYKDEFRHKHMVRLKESHVSRLSAKKR